MNWLSRLLPGKAPVLDLALRTRLEHCAARPSPDMSLSHFETRYVVVNTEASGLDLDRDPLLAVAGISIQQGILDPCQAYYAPLGDHPAEALTGLLEFIDRSPVVVFNSGFNQIHLERAFDSVLGLPPELEWLDLYWLLPAFFPEFHSSPARLAEWMASFEIETFQRHHGLGDAYAIAQLFLALLGRTPTVGIATPKALMEAEKSRRWLRQPG